MNKRNLYLTATAVFFVLQLAVIGSVIVQGNLVLARGVECRFKATGYDPSDPLRGRYVRFQADVSTTAVDEALSNRFCKAYFQLSETPDADGLTPVLRCAAKPTAEGLWIGPLETCINHTLSWGDQEENETDEAFRERLENSPRIARAELPEKFYTPENVAPELEQRLRREGASAVAVYRVYKGHILLTDLQVVP